MSEINIHQQLIEQAAAGRSVALATVLRTRGSVPRHAGSKMIIDPANERLIGTIGGGCGEADVIAAAREAGRLGADLCRVIFGVASLESPSARALGRALVSKNGRTPSFAQSPPGCGRRR